MQPFIFMMRMPGIACKADIYSALTAIPAAGCYGVLLAQSAVLLR